jgi:serine/threonine protein kinase
MGQISSTALENSKPEKYLKKHENNSPSNKTQYIRQQKKFNTEKAQINPNENKSLYFEYKTIGKSLTDYTLLKVIGRGTFGKVMLVRSKLDNKFYALKCLKKLDIEEMRYEHLIKAEKRVLEKIDHPFIIKLFLTFQTPEKLYMLFDYNNGGELFFHLQNKTRFNEDLARFYAVQLYFALGYLHNNNILYRDIKPENIILDNKGYIKLIDFGLSKDKFYSDSLTGTLCGTSEYLGIYNLTIAPELILGEQYGYNLDWWGFGILLYEILIGAPPFIDENKTRLFNKIVNDEPSFKFNDEKINISYEAKDLICKLLAKKPKDRIKPENIPLHPWFKNISFDEIYRKNIVAPFVPKIVNKI